MMNYLHRVETILYFLAASWTAMLLHDSSWALLPGKRVQRPVWCWKECCWAPRPLPNCSQAWTWRNWQYQWCYSESRQSIICCWRWQTRQPDNPCVHPRSVCATDTEHIRHWTEAVWRLSLSRSMGMRVSEHQWRDKTTRCTRLATSGWQSILVTRPLTWRRPKICLADLWSLPDQAETWTRKKLMATTSSS